MGHYEPRTGIEPMTCPLRVGRSCRLSYRGITPGRVHSRTPGLSRCSATELPGSQAPRAGFEPATSGWLGYLDSNQDCQVQNLVRCRLRNTP